MSSSATGVFSSPIPPCGNPMHPTVLVYTTRSAPEFLAASSMLRVPSTFERGGVAQIARGRLQFEFANVAARPHQRADRIAPLQQHARHVPPEEAGGAGDQPRLHGLPSAVAQALLPAGSRLISTRFFAHPPCAGMSAGAAD